MTWTFSFKKAGEEELTNIEVGEHGELSLPPEVELKVGTMRQIKHSVLLLIREGWDRIEIAEAV